MTQLTVTDDILTRANLSETDHETVVDLAQTLDLGSPMAAYDWGKDVAKTTAEYADSMLDAVQTREMDQAGNQLQEIVEKAQSVNFQPSSIPVVGPLVDKVRKRTSKLQTEFKSARDSIEQTASQIGETQQSLEQRISDLESTYDHIQQEAHALGQYIAAGELAKQRIDGELEELEGKTQTQDVAQRISDLKALRTNMDKRITDLEILQQNAYNTLPEIRMIQNNNATLVDKYHSIINTTIPLWKQQMVMGLALQEQTRAVELANDVDDFTNKMLKDHASQLKKNTLATAKANQRHVIDVETLSEVQSTLEDTVKGVRQIQNQSQQKNEQARAKVLSFRSNLQKVLTDEALEDASQSHNQGTEQRIDDKVEEA